MDHELEESLKDTSKVLFLEIPDVDDVAANLYVLKGGRSPPKPLVGDFAYDFARGTFEVYHPNGWRKVLVSDVESLVRHPTHNNSIVSFTASGLPFWKKMTRGQVTQRCTFSSVEALLVHIRQTLDSRKLKVSTLPVASEHTNCERGSDGHSEYLSGVRGLEMCQVMIYIQKERCEKGWMETRATVKATVSSLKSSAHGC